MCETCGCGEPAGDGHARPAGGRYVFAAPTKRVRVERSLLANNDAVAAENRAWLAARGLYAVNVVAAPGAGKTTLVVRWIEDLARTARASVVVIEGDQATARDAERVRAAGAAAVQINTGAGCHLDAPMVRDALAALAPPRGTLVVIENVGNLVCPALFDLGEAARVVVTSVTEGDDKPEKYPHMFRSGDALMINKVDLAPYVQFDVAQCRARALAQNPRLAIFETSATRGDGLEGFYTWLLARRASAQGEGIHPEG